MSALFDGLVGQPLAVHLLDAALQHKRVAPAYLFAGPDGVGRRLAALRFLEGVLSEGRVASVRGVVLRRETILTSFGLSPPFSIKVGFSRAMRRWTLE